MSGELVKLNQLPVQASKYADDKTFAGVSSGGGFLPRLQLFGATSNLCKEGKIGMGNYGLVRSKDSVEDLTKEVNVLVLAWRPKALEIGADEIISIFNPNNDEFKRIAAKSEESDSGCMFGPEFLVYIPAVESYATFFMSSKSSRREAPSLKALMGKAATIRSKLVKTKKYMWHAPDITMCSQQFEIPAQEVLVEQINRFNNPPETESEAAPTDEADRAR